MSSSSGGRSLAEVVRVKVTREELSAEKVPALYVKMGVKNEEKGITAMIHTEDFDLDERVLPLGVRAVATLLWDRLAARP